MSKEQSVEPYFQLDDDVYFYVDFIAKQRGEPEMMESLRLIVDDIIADLQTRQLEPLKDVTPTDVLLALASRGFAQFEGVAPVGFSEFGEPDSDKYVWVATPDLIECLETGGYGVVKRTNSHRSKIRMDALLIKLRDDHYRMHKTMGQRLSRRQKHLFRICTLLAAEKDGDALPYRDADGRLAFKASEHLKRQ